MRAALVCLCGLGVAVAAVLAQTGARTLDIYFIDTEGGQSTLFVSPTGESLLVDTGNPGDRDVLRIVEALAAANVTQIDHLWTTHYHVDHVGGMQQLASRVPIRHFYDHGRNVEPREQVAGFAAMYEELSKGKRTSMKPGDTLRMAGLDITTVASAGQGLAANLTGGGRANPACANLIPKTESPTDDNGQSAGFVLTYGKFRTIDLGDLLWNRELDLMCPVNRIGTVDVYLTTHHGLNQSGSPALVHGLAPRVVIMNNGTRKGGSVEAFQTVHTSPGLEDLWQLHWSYNAGLDHNAPGVFIANVEPSDTVAGILTAAQPAPRGAAAHVPAYWIKVSARPDGAFSVTNARNGFSKSYRSR
jgi:beta-lactamase superfamily II metal-dependent hydrolase